MFEQFKRISSSLSFKDFVVTNGLNEGELKNISRQGIQAVKTEWENIRNKSAEILIPANLTPRLGALSPIISGSSIRSSTKSPTIQSLDLAATSELAKKYEEDWNSIRAEDERNFKNALADRLITQALKTCEDHFQACELLKSEASQLHKFKEEVDDLTIFAVQLKGKLTELDQMIIDLAKGNEVQDFEEWKQSEHILLNQYMDNRNAEFEKKKEFYKQQYMEFLKNFQLQKAQAYQADFEAQMEIYRRQMENQQLTATFPEYRQSDDEILSTLENLELDTSDDRDALEEFLGSLSDTENEKAESSTVLGEKNTNIHNDTEKIFISQEQHQDLLYENFDSNGLIGQKKKLKEPT
ncbi:2227_t:CDS:10 [Ambispora leptoticha]|uniref:2227_t:CDS:1 n=1 Tax=Ambispora leptoticha TaxID=144679 RepID=A0A9N8YQZ7_9GLOM|nr:2227_t:CDS:10 [Ambispora leptoticha]